MSGVSVKKKDEREMKGNRNVIVNILILSRKHSSFVYALNNWVDRFYFLNSRQSSSTNKLLFIPVRCLGIICPTDSDALFAGQRSSCVFFRLVWNVLRCGVTVSVLLFRIVQKFFHLQMYFLWQNEKTTSLIAREDSHRETERERERKSGNWVGRDKLSLRRQMAGSHFSFHKTKENSLVNHRRM